MNVLNVKKILVPLDFSETSLKALDYAQVLAKKNDAEIILLHVTEDLYENLEHDYYTEHPLLPSFEKEFTDRSYEEIATIAENLKRNGIKNVNTIIEEGTIASEILDVAKRNNVDLIVMGTHGIAGTAEFIFGSNTYKVVNESLCPVLSIRQNENTSAFKNILMPFWNKPNSLQKINYAIGMASMFAADLNVLCIDTDYAKGDIYKIVESEMYIRKRAKEAGVHCKIRMIAEGIHGEEVLKYANTIDADIIISTDDFEIRSLKEYFTGPVAQQIVNHSTIPVLSIRPNFITDALNIQALQARV